MSSREYVYNSRPSLFDSDGNEINVASDKGKKVSAMSICLLTDDLGTDFDSYSKYYQVFDGKYYCGICHNEILGNNSNCNLFLSKDHRNKDLTNCTYNASGPSGGISNVMDHSYKT